MFEENLRRVGLIRICTTPKIFSGDKEQHFHNVYRILMTDSVKREQKSLSMCGELVTPTHIFRRRRCWYVVWANR